MFCSCVNSSAFEIRVCFELQNSTTILDLETTYTNVQGFFFLQMILFLIVVDGRGMCLWSCKIYNCVDFCFCYLECGGVGWVGGEWKCPYCDGASFIRNIGIKFNTNAARKDLFQIVCKHCNGFGKIGNMSCSYCSSSHNFSFLFCGGRLEIWSESCMLSFRVFGNMIFLIYNPTQGDITSFKNG